MMFTKLTDNLYLYRDICNVYVVKDGSRAILIQPTLGHSLGHIVLTGKVDGRRCGKIAEAVVDLGPAADWARFPR